MRKNYKLLPLAQADFRSILHYIGRDNIVAAERMRELFYYAFRRLGVNPYIGQEREDLTDKAVRFLVVYHNYMIIYKADTNPVQILRIYNSAQNIDSILH